MTCFLDWSNNKEWKPPLFPTRHDLSPPLYFQLVYTLTGLLPPPLDDSPDALLVRNRAAIAKVAALRPVNPDELDLAGPRLPDLDRRDVAAAPSAHR